MHVRLADLAYALRGTTMNDTYLDIDSLLSVARSAEADAVHPGSSMLAADPRFARAVKEAGLTWIGPPPESLELLGQCQEPRVEKSRRIAVDVVADGRGSVVVVGDRDATLQRRRQPIASEAPAPSLSVELRSHLHATARQVLQDAGYLGVGTVEFLVADDTTVTPGKVRPQLLPEHATTEMVTGLDLVAQQLRVSEGRGLSIPDTPQPHGHSLGFTILAEDPGRGFLPSHGVITELHEPGGPGIRWDAGVQGGDRVEAEFTTSLAHLAVHGHDRTEAVARARRAVGEHQIVGVATVRPMLEALVAEPRWLAPEPVVDTDWVEHQVMPRLAPQRRAPRAVE